MKLTLINSAMAASLFLAAPAFADDAHHPEKAQSAAGAPTAKPAKETVKSMQDNLKKMQKQLDGIARAKTDEERGKLVAEHMATMRENMMMAKGMMGGEMHCPMMKDGMMGGHGGMGMGGRPGSPEERMDRMEKRMDMMQMMMDRNMMDGDGKPMPGMDKP